VKATNSELKARAVALRAGGLSWRKTAQELGVALSTLQRMMKD